jgi:Glucose-regulated metallo-peptidase M90
LLPMSTAVRQLPISPFASLLLASGFILGLTVPAFAYDPIERYEVRSIEGWTIRVHQQLLKEDKLARQTLRLLEFQLYQITRVVPTNAVAKLREIPIWVELAHPRHPCMCYHPSADWLRGHDMNPAKAGAVELANATNFLAWTKQQPWMVLHELAHGYHHRTLGHGHPKLKAAFEKAVASKTYETTLQWNGKTVRHYALNNEEEYFAEATEAFFGVNDYYPFVRAELRQHDPEMFALLHELWGVTPAKTN